jgi:hypothetical protein
MTITYGFYDSISEDRLYDAKQMGSIFDGIIQDGVYAGLGDKLMVVEDVDMDVSVGTGRAWFDHTWTYNDAAISKAIATADALLNRIDVVYLEVNENVGVRANSISVLTGTPATDPVAPDLTNTSSIHQYPLAHVYVGAAVTEITQANITNKVGTVDTPFVAGIIDYVTTNEILAQWEAEWEEWFESIKGQLDGEAETLLQNQINAIVGDMNPPVLNILELKAHNHDGTDTVQIEEGGIAAGAISYSKLATGAVTTAKLDAGAVTSTKLAIDAVTAGKIAAGGVDHASVLANDVVENTKIKNLAITSNKLGNLAVTAGKIATGGVDTTAKLADDIVDDTKVGDRVPQLHRRRGGHATDWSVVGNTVYIPGHVRIQVGAAHMPAANGSGESSLNVVFPVAFGGEPIVLVSLNMADYFGSVNAFVTNNEQFNIRTFGHGASETAEVHWIAIGPD